MLGPTMFQVCCEAMAKCDGPWSLPLKSLSQQGRQISSWTVVFKGGKLTREVDDGMS